MKIMLFLLVLIFPSLTFANELSGNMTSEGDGSYSVTLENNNGHEYSGSAEDQGGGTLDVSVEDDEGNSYSGTATSIGNGQYELDLSNDATGGEASGSLTLEH